MCIRDRAKAKARSDAKAKAAAKAAKKAPKTGVVTQTDNPEKTNSEESK